MIFSIKWEYKLVFLTLYSPYELADGVIKMHILTQ